MSVLMKTLKCKNCDERGVPKNNSTIGFYCDKEDCQNVRIAKAVKKVRENKQKEEKEWVAKVKPKTHAKEYKADLQREINKLARMIDLKFYDTCIDCGNHFGTQIDGSHLHNVGSHNSTRWNLHNIHASKSDCNQFHGGRKEGYKEGILSRYGAEYLQMILELPIEYKSVKLSEYEVVEKLKIVRKLIRDFNTFNFSSAIQARNQCNTIIGIYPTINKP